MKSTKPELWLLLFKDFKLEELRKIGYNRFTVYKYKEQFPTVLRDYKRAKERIKELRINGGN
jgi:hypothetical protein